MSDSLPPFYSADNRISVKKFGAKGDGVANDTLALALAIALCGSAGTVLLPKGSYLIDTALSIPAGVGIVGEDIEQTTIKTASAIQMLAFQRGGGAANRYGRVGGFRLDGGNAATIGLFAQKAVYRLFQTIHITNCVEGMVCPATQNCIFNDIHIYNSSTAGLVLCNGAANNLFERVELDTSNLVALRVENYNAAYSNDNFTTFNNTFIRLITEYPGGSSVHPVKLLGGSQQSFIDCDLGIGGTTGRRCVFSDGASSTLFHNCRFNGASTTDTFVEITSTAVGIAAHFDTCKWVGQTAGAHAIATGQKIFITNPDLNNDSYDIVNTAGDADYNLNWSYGIRPFGAAADPSGIPNRLPGTFQFGNNKKLFFTDKSGFYPLVTDMPQVRGTTTTPTATSHSTTAQLPRNGTYLLTAQTTNGDFNHRRVAVFLVAWYAGGSSNKLNAVTKLNASDLVSGSVMTALSASVDVNGVVTISDTSSSTGGNIDYDLLCLSSQTH